MSVTVMAPSERNRGINDRIALLEGQLKRAEEDCEACHRVIEEIVRSATKGEEVKIVDRWGDSVIVAVQVTEQE